jgi:uroporphyrinogen decarboxylase
MNSQVDKIISVIKKQTEYAVFPIVCVDHCTHLTRTKFADVARDGEKIAQVLEYGYGLYEYDMVLLFVDAYVEAQALGCQVNFDPYAILVGPRSDQAFDRTGEVIKAAQLLKEKLKVPVFVSIKGPFTLAAFFVGIQDFLKMVLKNPRDAEKNLELVTAFQLEYLKRLLEVGVNIFIGDPVASASVISPEVFKDFAYRPLKMLIKEIRDKDALSGVHICGDTAPLISMLDTLRPDILSIEDITLKTKITKMGGVSTSTILHGELSKIEDDLIISTSCDVPVETNPGNIKHMIACAHEYSNN